MWVVVLGCNIDNGESNTGNSGIVTTIAGAVGVEGSNDGIGTNATFKYPADMTYHDGYLYVADSYNHVIRKIDISSGEVTTLAGTAGTIGFADGTGAAAEFYYPEDITYHDGYVYVTDTNNHVIRKIDIASGVVTTFAGTAETSGSADGTGTAATFRYPYGITSDDDYLYVTDWGNYLIRKIEISSGAVTTIAGTVGVWGTDDGIGIAAKFRDPVGITKAGSFLYIADFMNHTIRKINISSGAVTTFAGTAGETGSSDGTGNAAEFNYPEGITNDGNYLYVSDSINHTIRKIDISNAEVTTIAGTAGVGGSDDGNGTTAKFQNPYGITFSGTYLYVADYGNHTIRRIALPE